MFWTTKITNQKGLLAEKQALEYLKRKGLKLTDRNYACPTGELDLIMQDGETLVFIEVRYRSSILYGTALESIDWTKQQRICKTASHYLQQKGLTDKCPCRFDIITAQPAAAAERPEFEWIRDAFCA